MKLGLTNGLYKMVYKKLILSCVLCKDLINEATFGLTVQSSTSTDISRQEYIYPALFG